MANPPKSKASETGEVARNERPEIKYPRRTERRRRTRATILKVAADLFSKTGYGPTTMQAIADEADVHVTTLFMHFNAKSDLALGLVASSIEDLRERAAQARGQIAFEAYFRGEAQHFASAMKTGPDMKLWKALRNDSELAFAWSEYDAAQKEVFASYLADDRDMDRVQDYRPDLAATLLGASLFLAHQKWAEASGRLNLSEEVSKAVETALQGAQAILSSADKTPERP